MKLYHVYSIQLSQLTTTVYQVAFDEMLKETGHGLHIIMSKYPEMSHCKRPHDRFNVGEIR